MRRAVSAAELRARIHYDPDTGIFTWRSTGRVWGYVRKPRGYLAGTINQRGDYLHRFAWLYMTGEWPVEEIDHKNLHQLDNRWHNLRAATHAQNEGNTRLRDDSTSGFKGVSWHKCKSRWRAHITVNNRHISLGYHDTPELAHRAYCAAAAKHFGQFARTA